MQEFINQELLWDTRALANYLSKSPAWVRNSRSRLEIPAFKVGKQLRYRKSDIDNWLEGQSASNS